MNSVLALEYQKRNGCSLNDVCGRLLCKKERLSSAKVPRSKRKRRVA